MISTFRVMKNKMIIIVSYIMSTLASNGFGQGFRGDFCALKAGPDQRRKALLFFSKVTSVCTKKQVYL